MIYNLTRSFTQISETTGTIQNTSSTTTLEMSTNNSPDTGILIFPLQKVSFSNKTIFLRCTDGAGAQVRVIPFELVTEGGDMQAVTNAFQDISYDNGVLSFLNANGDVVKNFNLPEEIYLRSVGTTFVTNFVFSGLLYPNATNPNLNGKPVLVLHVKGDDLNNPYDNYFFVNMEDLINLYLPADNSISISGNSVAVNISASSGNLLSLSDDGLFVSLDVLGGSSSTHEFDSALANIFQATGGTSTPEFDSELNNIFGMED